MASRLKVFLCYSPDDKSIVRELYRQLNAEGWMDVWMDENILPGENKEIEIEQAIDDADITLVCLSVNAVQKEGNVHQVLRAALRHAEFKPEETVYIIPIRLEDCELPRQLRQWQPADYFAGNKERAYQNLLRSLRKRLQSLESSSDSKRSNITKIVDKPSIPAATLSNSTSVGGNINGKNIIMGNNNTINVVSHPGKDQTSAPKPSTKSRQPPKTKTEQRIQPNSKPKVKPIHLVVLAVILLVISFLFFGGQITGIQGVAGEGRNSSVNAESIPSPNGDIQTSPKDGMTMVYVAPGTFNMGSEVNQDETPIHSVDVPGFWIDQTEVTNAMYALCVREGKCTARYEMMRLNDSAYMSHPVVNVSWYDAKSYCEWAGERLPTEAEWEKAARGTDQRIYPWGNTPPNSRLLNYDNNTDTTMVDGYPNGHSPYGALDMAGNVWEWVSSLYIPYPYNAQDGRENLYASGNRVIRGGSWKDGADLVRSSDRYEFSPDIFLDNLGFRCAQSQ